MFFLPHFKCVCCSKEHWCVFFAFADVHPGMWEILCSLTADAPCTVRVQHEDVVFVTFHEIFSRAFPAVCGHVLWIISNISRVILKSFCYLTLYLGEITQCNNKGTISSSSRLCNCKVKSFFISSKPAFDAAPLRCIHLIWLSLTIFQSVGQRGWSFVWRV